MRSPTKKCPHIHTLEVAERQLVGPVEPHRIHHRVDREVDEVKFIGLYRGSRRALDTVDLNREHHSGKGNKTLCPAQKQLKKIS
jgi:hypothetical protein